MMKIETCKQCDGHGSTNYAEWSQSEEDVEIINCDACDWNGFLITEPPKNLYDFFKFIHAYQSVSGGELIPEYGIKRAFSFFHPASMIRGFLGNFGGGEDDWNKTMIVFFGETEKENHALYNEWSDDEVHWYMEGHFNRPYAPSLNNLFDVDSLSKLGLDKRP